MSQVFYNFFLFFFCMLKELKYVVVFVIALIWFLYSYFPVFVLFYFFFLLIFTEVIFSLKFDFSFFINFVLSVCVYFFVIIFHLFCCCKNSLENDIWQGVRPGLGSHLCVVHDFPFFVVDLFRFFVA